MDSAKPLSHIGVDVWTAYTAYRRSMYAQVATSGFADITEADSDVLVWIGPKGTTITAIAKARGVTKQAVQGQVQSLIARGFLDTRIDPLDTRARILTHSAKGRALAAALDKIKKRLDGAVKTRIGADDYDRLRLLLGEMAEVLKEDP